VSLAVEPGQIHAVLGENGAGKSTLMKIIYGAVKPDAGQIRFDGHPVAIRDPRAARALGIAMVFQHFSLFETLSVAENVWLGLDRAMPLAQVVRRIRATAEVYGLPIDPLRPVHTLAVGQMQRVEIIRALLTEPRLLILDEPTSVLTPQAVDKLFETLRQLARQGCSLLYISHKLHEIQALCTACTVLRAGRVTGECDPRTETPGSLSRLMIGAQPPLPNPLPQAGDGVKAPVLEVRELNLPRQTPFGVDLAGVTLTVHAGEIVGIAGVSGNGQNELLNAISGEDTRAPNACILIANKPIGRLPLAPRRALGLHLAPEERLGRGAAAQLSLAHNLLLTRREAVGRGGWLHIKRLRAQADGIIARFKVKAAGPDAPARSLSGGNLQKFIMGREIDAQPRLLIAAQPTWGVDVGAAAQIHAALLALRDAGGAVLLVSEELDELLALCDRLYVIAKGRLSPPVPRQHASLEQIGLWMSGLWHEESQHAAP
jgi:simple sugar transport system ATP-binding protein